MRTLCLIGWLGLATACSSYGVRCDTRLRPINLPQAVPAATNPQPGPSGSSGSPGSPSGSAAPKKP
jgi:hypothetical protein